MPLAPRPTHWTTAVVLALLAATVPAGIAAALEEHPGRGAWRSVTPAPTKRTEVAAAVIGGTIYVVGGFDEPSLSKLPSLLISRTLEAYDAATDTWRTQAPLPAGRHHAGVAAVGGKLYVIGGFTQSMLSVWHAVATVYMYDPEQDTWTERAPMPTPRGALATAVLGEKIVAIAGANDDGNTGAVEEYDPAANTWRRLASLPIPRDHLAAAAVGSQLYAIGGRLNRDYHRNVGTTDRYDAGADRWTRIAELPTPRSGITAGVVDGVVYVAGGEGPDGTFAQNEAYFPERDEWRAMAPMPTARHGLGSAVWNGRWFVLAGGPTPGGSFSNAAEAFDPPRHAEAPRPSRASATQVGTVMALLATLQDADALPPESSPDANRIIKALIQFQAALMKSEAPAVRRFLHEALAEQDRTTADTETNRFRVQGWTSRSLEAVIAHADRRPLWEDAAIRDGFAAFNVGRDDFRLLSQVVRTAQQRFSAQGQNLHTVYMAHRRKMPGFENAER